MPDQNFEATADTLDLYDIAVLVFTTPEIIGLEEKDVVLTGKDVYVWAGIVAFLADKYPSISERDMISTFRRALRDNAASFYLANTGILNRLERPDVELQVIRSFISYFEISEEQLQEI